MYKILIIFAGLFYCINAIGQADLNKTDSGKQINSSLASASKAYADTLMFSFNKDSIILCKQNKTYSWFKNLDSLLRAEQTLKLQPKRTPSLLEGLFNSSFFKMLLWLIAAAFVGFIIYRLFITDGIFKKEHRESLKEETEEQENSMTKNYDSLLKNAYANHNFRMAMRYLFLQTLQRLYAHELIIFAPEKTNSAYVNELPTAKRNEFASLALYYDYIWYGNVTVEKQTYDMIAQKFTDFINTI